MTGAITRRDAVLRTAALASASMIPAAPVAGIAAPPRQSARSEEIDRALQARVSAREIPGVVAMAANEQSVVYKAHSPACANSRPAKEGVLKTLGAIPRTGSLELHFFTQNSQIYFFVCRNLAGQVVGGLANLWGPLPSDRWSWFIRKISELNSKSPLV